MSGAATGKLIRGAGGGVKTYIKAFCASITLTGVTGAFAHDEVVTAAGGFEGRVVYFDADADVLYVYVMAGALPTSGTVTGASSAASGTASASAAGVFTPYLRFAGVAETITTNRTRASQTIADFDTDPDDFAAKITGVQEGSISTTLNMVITDPGYQIAESAFNFNLLARIKGTRTTMDGTATQERIREGSFSAFNETDRQGNVSQVAVTFEISALVTPTQDV